jgi:hypothetical protein
MRFARHVIAKDAFLSLSTLLASVRCERFGRANRPERGEASKFQRRIDRRGKLKMRRGDT